MFSALDVVRTHLATYYNYNTGKSYSMVAHYGISISLALMLAFIFQRGSDNFLTGVMAAQSVLAGFAFSVLFNIGSSVRSQSKSDSIEEEIRSEKLVILQDELFANISYFILVAVSCICSALILLLTYGDRYTFSRFDYIKNIRELVVSLSVGHLADVIARYVSYAENSADLAIFFVNYFLILDSIKTFARVVDRVNFIFHRRRALSVGRPAEPADQS